MSNLPGNSTKVDGEIEAAIGELSRHQAELSRHQAATHQVMDYKAKPEMVIPVGPVLMILTILCTIITTAIVVGFLVG